MTQVKVIRENGKTNFILPFAPVPASRPRVTRWGAYYSKTYQQWMEEAEVYLGVQPKRKTIKTPCWVSILLFCKKAKTSKLTVPRGDVDNYAKAVLDAMVKARILQDDNLVVRLSVLKCFDQINKPMVSVSVEPAAVI